MGFCKSHSIARVARGLMVIALSGATASAATTGNAKRKIRFAPGQILVRMRPSARAEAARSLHQKIGASLLRQYRNVPNLDLVKLPPGLSVESAIARYRKQKDVLYAEPDYLVTATQLPNDPNLPSLWGLQNTGQNGGKLGADIDAPKAWNLTTGSDQVVIGVIDTGIDYTHIDLSANIWVNPNDCDQDGVDDDSNGYADDCHGIDTVNHDSDPMDDHFHGTHVAGTIGARGNNGIGVVGVSWQVKMIACKFLDADGTGFTSEAIECLDYFATLKQKGVNIIATNNSWGGGGFSQALYDAIAKHMESGLLFVAAAGNNGFNNDGFGFFPASYDLANVIAVAATDRNDELASFSNHGRRTVHLGAPGVDIWSTAPNSEYRSLNGTSMATPHVTGVLALLKAQDPSRDWKALKNLVVGTGDILPAVDTTISGRRLNAYAALTCTDQGIFRRLAPAETITAIAGTPITLTMMHTVCAAPSAEPLVVTVQPGGTAVALHDDGVAPDQTAGDGIFNATWALPAAGDYSLAFPNGDSVQITVPVTYTYTAVPYQYREITGTNPNLSRDEVVQLDSPFPIRFAGLSSNTIYASINGVISFVPWIGHQNYLPLVPTGFNETDFTERFIAPLWANLEPQSGTARNVFWAVVGAAPNRELVIEWRDLNINGILVAGDDAAVTFQVVFFENSDDILFNYKDMTFSPEWPDDNGGGTAAIGLQVAWNFGTALGCCIPRVADQSSVMWSPGSTLKPSLMLTGPPELYAGNAPIGGNGCHGQSDGHPIPCFTVVGSYFQPGAQLYWDGSPRWSYIENSNILVAALDGSDFTPGTYPLKVVNPEGEESNVLELTVHDGAEPVPHIDFLSPASALVGTNGLKLVVNGSGFIATPGSHSLVTLESCAFFCIPLKTVALNDHQLVASVPDSALAFPTSWQVLVENPARILVSENWSNLVDFHVTSPDGPTVTVHATSRAIDGPGGVVLDDIGKMSCRVAVIDFPVTCSRTYNPGQTITLRALPDFGASFAGWSGACAGIGICTLTLDGDQSVTADFQFGGHLLTVLFAGEGTGTVNDPANHFSCSSSCSISLAPWQTLQLSASGTGSSAFLGWSGACTGRGSCTLDMAQDRTITATFGQPVPQFSVSASAIDFGGVLLGHMSPPRQLTLANIGPVPLLITGITTSAGFTVESDCGTSIAVNTSCLITTTFRAEAIGERSGELTIATNAGAPFHVSLHGSGVDIVLTLARPHRPLRGAPALTLEKAVIVPMTAAVRGTDVMRVRVDCAAAGVVCAAQPASAILREQPIRLALRFTPAIGHRLQPTPTSLPGEVVVRLRAGALVFRTSLRIE